MKTYETLGLATLIMIGTTGSALAEVITLVTSVVHLINM